MDTLELKYKSRPQLGQRRQAVAPIGRVQQLWRFPVKSMAGEVVPEVTLTAGGVHGDRAYASLDVETGRVASAKDVRHFPQLLQCRAAFVAPPIAGDDLPDGSEVRSVLGPAVHVQVHIPAPRCVMVTRAQAGVTEDLGVLRALLRHNRLPVGPIGPAPCCGLYATVAAGGALGLGDAVELR